MRNTKKERQSQRIYDLNDEGMFRMQSELSTWVELDGVGPTVTYFVSDFLAAIFGCVSKHESPASHLIALDSVKNRLIVFLLFCGPRQHS